MDTVFYYKFYEEFEESLLALNHFIEKAAGTKRKGMVCYSVIEAVNNAFEHGNSENKSNFSVVLKLYKDSNNILHIEVSHNGQGFDYISILNCLHDLDVYMIQKQSSARGRGIAIMKKVSEQLSYSNKGKKLELKFA